MSYFGRNIKKIRTAKKISQTAFADLFNLKRGSIGAYEEGRAEAKIDTIIEIAAHFKLTMDQLLCKELTLNEIYHISEINQRFEKSILQNDNESLIPLVTAKDRTEFIKKFDNQTFLQGLKSIQLNNVKAHSVAFELISIDLPNEKTALMQGDIIIAEPIDKKELESYLVNTNFIILENDRFHLVELHLNGNQISFKSMNQEFSTILVKYDDIQAIYKPIQLITKKIQFKSVIASNLFSIETKLDKILKSKGLL